MSARRDTPRRGSPARPVVATAETVVLGATAHTAAGGALPSADLLVALTLVTGAVCWALHQRLLRAGTASLLAVAAQAAVHVAGSYGVAAHADHLHSAVVGPPDTGMLLAHAMGAAVTVLALVWQEHALLVLAHALLPGRAPLVATHSAPAAPRIEHVLRHVARLTLDVAPRRGPPPVCASPAS